MTCNNIWLLVACALYCTGCAEGEQEKIALVGSGVDQVVVIDKASGAVEWRYDLPQGSECNTVAVTKGGDVLFSYKQGVRMVDRATQATLWDFVVEEGQEAQTARLVDDQKRVLVGVCGVPMIQIVELDAQTGEMVSKVEYNLEIPYVHNQFRQICKTEAGTYLIPVISQDRVVEINALGEQVGQWAVPPMPFSVQEVEGGKTLLVSTYGALVELDRAAPEALRVVSDGLLGADTVRFGTEARRMANGHTIWANWQGYDPQATDAQLIEFDPKGTVHYRLADTTVMRYVSGFYLFKE